MQTARSGLPQCSAAPSALNLRVNQPLQMASPQQKINPVLAATASQTAQSLCSSRCALPCCAS